jgi:hypothetical protein
MASFLKYVDLYLTSEWGRFYVGHSVDLQYKFQRLYTSLFHYSRMCYTAVTDVTKMFYPGEDHAGGSCKEAITPTNKTPLSQC